MLSKQEDHQTCEYSLKLREKKKKKERAREGWESMNMDVGIIMEKEDLTTYDWKDCKHIEDNCLIKRK